MPSTNTTNFSLIKPGQEEFYNVDVPNSNMDTIDGLLKALQDEATTSKVKNLGFRGLLADSVSGIGGPDHISKYPEGLSVMYTDRTDWAVFLNMTDFISATEFLFVETNKSIQDGKINATQQITRYKKESTSTPVKLISQYKRVWYSDASYTGWSNAEKVVFQTELTTHLAESAAKHITASGSNANGNYIRYDDGTQICWSTISYDATSAVTKIYPYPSAFIDRKISASVSGSKGTGAFTFIASQIEDLNKTICAADSENNWGVRTVPVGSNTNLGLGLLAIGRWK